MTQVEPAAALGGTPAPDEERPRRHGLGARQRTLVALGILGLAFLLPLRGLLRAQGPPMEEGFMLVFPTLVLHGEIPNRDFLYLYGPGSVWVLAGVFKVFGTSLITERLFGLLQQIGIVLGVFGLARYWGRTAATLCALISLVLILPPIGLTALPWPGAVALGLLGMLAAAEGRRAATESRAARLMLLGGALLGFSLLYRPDLVLGVALAGLALGRGLERMRQRRLVTGLALGVAPYLVHLVTAGPGTVIRGLVLDPLVYLRGGRRLPIPPPTDHLDGFLQHAGEFKQLHWPFPALRTPMQLAGWFWFLLATVAFLVVVAWWRARREPDSLRARVLLALALFGLGMTPQALQRVDSAHFAWVSCVPVAVLPLGVLAVLRGHVAWLPPRARSLLVGGGVLLALVVFIPYLAIRPYVDYTVQTFGFHRIAYKIEHKGRVFYYGREDAADAATALLDKVEQITKPGDRVLVGTTDLRKTPYSDAYLYFMLPRLRPSTYYIEMDPGVANRKGSRLADDVRHSDIVILGSVWNDWSEPNDSRKFGSDLPNRILRRDFCLVEGFGVNTSDGGPVYELFRRCTARGPSTSTHS